MWRPAARGSHNFDGSYINFSNYQHVFAHFEGSFLENCLNYFKTLLPNHAHWSQNYGNASFFAFCTYIFEFSQPILYLTLFALERLGPQRPALARDHIFFDPIRKQLCGACSWMSEGSFCIKLWLQFQCNQLLIFQQFAVCSGIASQHTVPMGFSCVGSLLWWLLNRLWVCASVECVHASHGEGKPDALSAQPGLEKSRLAHEALINCLLPHFVERVIKNAVKSCEFHRY